MSKLVQGLDDKGVYEKIEIVPPVRHRKRS